MTTRIACNEITFFNVILNFISWPCHIYIIAWCPLPESYIYFYFQSNGNFKYTMLSRNHEETVSNNARAISRTLPTINILNLVSFLNTFIRVLTLFKFYFIIVIVAFDIQKLCNVNICSKNQFILSKITKNDFARETKIIF